MRRPPRAALPVGALVLALAVSGCSGGPPGRSAAAQARTFPSGTTMHAIQQRGEVVVGVKYDQPSFGLLNPLTGKPEGFDIEIARLVAEDLTGSPRNVRYVETVTSNREAFIEQGKVDLVIASYVVNEKRKKKVSFAGPYYDTGIAVLARRDDHSIRDAHDLDGRPVCVAQGSHSAEVLPKVVPGVRLVEFSSYSYCAQALKDRRVDATVTSESILIGLEQQNPDELRVVPGYLEAEQTAIGFTKGDRELHAYLSGLLKEAVRDGRWGAAYRATVGKVTGQAPKPPEITL
ncbi:ABC transporter substrate-binding protein [Streptomyces albidoflavus]|uniref:glutamate ABC transporter substrate-binding protein n=1 Tax=Streptomyces albidoflavus TaxID=1886 RepID=UPI00101E25A6|nr:glutamate ABC transporter substrate-binding protein [Streptomyces albidoflavus]RZD96040.1 ABC transporter substrate-binding protein [Streptomyces albidoflavus]RZD98651.1 ABC transporter substrate-binding protein [Streptomyces albidoflavus]